MLFLLKGDFQFQLCLDYGLVAAFARTGRHLKSWSIHNKHTHTQHLRCRLSAAESPQAGGGKSWYRLIVEELSASCIHMEEEYRAETRKQISCCERVLYKKQGICFDSQLRKLCCVRLGGASERQLLRETSISNRLAPTLRYFSNSNTCTPS